MLIVPSQSAYSLFFFPLFHPSFVYTDAVMSFAAFTQITRKIIRKYVSADGEEREEVMVEGAQQEAITVDDADGFSKVVKRTVVRSAGDQTEVCVCFQNIFSVLKKL